MLSICAARLRTRLGRVPASIFRTQTKRSLSTGKPTSNSKLYVAIAASGASIPAALWWLNTTRDDVPYLENVSTEHLLIEPGPDEEQVSRILSQDSQSFLGRDVAGITRYYCAQLASNNPCEDRLIHGKFDAPWDDAKQWMVWAVFDGHIGSQTAELLKNQLLSFVRHDLSKLKSLSNTGSVPETFIQRAINDGFVNLDDSIIKSASRVGQSEESLKDKVKKPAPAWSGSCALLSLYDPVTGTLHVACTGDSRAVLGQKGPDGKWEATPLSVDQTGRNNEEIARICKEHPGEEDIIKNGRVLGIEVSRAFGDGQWKWSLDFQQDVQRRSFGPAPLTPKYDVRTPPYLTAEPVVTSTKIDPTKPSFLIMATDGLWNTLSSQQGVDLVGKWLESRAAERTNNKSEPAYSVYDSFDFSHFWKGVHWRFVEKRTTIQDDNVAVHLVRNALGGNHHELIAGRLAFSSPFARRVRDDITVQVAFFGILGLKKAVIKTANYTSAALVTSFWQPKINTYQAGLIMECMCIE
ncbi:hypothetical protein EIK77_001669 [Talaromyces pinophilus]|nr:hypothetical protein EIK77_001669 [Talaromyces pinophilus]